VVKIAVREKGQGKVLICLHGYAGSVLHWEKIAEDLSRLFKVVTPNLTRVYMGEKRLSFSQQIDVLAQFIENQYPQQTVFLAGISYGGALAWGLASRYPHLVDKVVLINPMPPAANRYFAMRSLRWLFSRSIPVSAIYLLIASPFGKFFLQQAGKVFRNFQNEEDRLENLRGRKVQFISHILANFSWLLHNEDWAVWTEKLQTWSHNSMLIYDRKDPVFTSEFYDGFARTLAGTNVVTTQDAGHISILQQPKLIAGAMLEYLLRDFYKEADGYN